MFQVKKKSRIVKDLLEVDLIIILYFPLLHTFLQLLYHDMTCMSSIMRAEVMSSNFDDPNHEISEEGYQVQVLH
jgi:hypothetical protein